MHLGDHAGLGHVSQHAPPIGHAGRPLACDARAGFGCCWSAGHSWLLNSIERQARTGSVKKPAGIGPSPHGRGCVPPTDRGVDFADLAHDEGMAITTPRQQRPATGGPSGAARSCRALAAIWLADTGAHTQPFRRSIAQCLGTAPAGLVGLRSATDLRPPGLPPGLRREQIVLPGLQRLQLLGVASCSQL